jgi:hypothetical protein
MDAIHFVVQFPVVTIQSMVGMLLLMRWRWANERRITEIDPGITLLMALFVLFIAGKQAFWMLHGALLAADLEAGAADLGRGHWAPVVGNAAILISGTALLARVGTTFIGWGAYALGVGAFVALIAVGSAVSKWG